MPPQTVAQRPSNGFTQFTTPGMYLRHEFQVRDFTALQRIRFSLVTPYSACFPNYKWATKRAWRETGGPHALEQKVRRAGHLPRLLRCPAGGDRCLCPMPARIPLVLPFRRLRAQRPASRLLPAATAASTAGLGGKAVQLGLPELRLGLRRLSRLRTTLQPSVQSLY